MKINRLNIQYLRNLTMVAIHQLQPFNVFYGENGSGKTSVLESIHLLATGRSFRTHLPKLYIQNQQQEMLIFAQSEQNKIGIKRLISGEQILKINGDTIVTQSQLAKLLPVQYIDPKSSDILDHGSKPRRQMLDWLMFHVEHEFYQVWQQYEKALKQRNYLLKNHKQMSISQLETWNKLLAEYGEILHQQRNKGVEQWQSFFKQELSNLLPEIEIKMSYYAGFHTELGLLHDLTYNHVKDLEQGNTKLGPHRADLRFKTELGEASDFLSRGQKKMLMIALKLSQIAMIHSRNRETVVLLDDLTAELDVPSQKRLLQRLAQLGSQVFLTSLDAQMISSYLQELDVNYALFYVNQGQIQPS